MPSGRTNRAAITALAAFLFALAIAGGIGYEQAERRGELERFPRVGRAVDIGGRSLNLYCSGEGSPAVVLESDALAPGYAWVHIQREIARLTRACWYDRAGYGWSDPAPAPRTSAATARDLHRLLQTAGVSAPYLLVGDGFGGFNVRVYAGLYPGDVAGVLLVDPIREDAEGISIAGRVPFHLGYPPDLVIQTISRIGLLRVMPGAKRREIAAKGLTAAEQAELSGLAREPKMRAAFLAEQAFTTSLEEVRGLPSQAAVLASESGEKLAFSAPERVIAAVSGMLGR